MSEYSNPIPNPINKECFSFDSVIDSLPSPTRVPDSEASHLADYFQGFFKAVSNKYDVIVKTASFNDLKLQKIEPFGGNIAIFCGTSDGKPMCIFQNTSQVNFSVTLSLREPE